MGLWVLGSTAYGVLVLGVPRAESRSFRPSFMQQKLLALLGCRNFTERRRECYTVRAHPNLAYS